MTLAGRVVDNELGERDLGAGALVQLIHRDEIIESHIEMCVLRIVDESGTREFIVPDDKAMDAFRHPYAYLPKDAELEAITHEFIEEPS